MGLGTREPAEKQAERMFNVLERVVGRFAEKDPDKTYEIRYKALLAKADANSSTMRTVSMKDRIDQTDGLEYVFQKGVVKITPREFDGFEY